MIEKPRPATSKDCGDEYIGMLIAHAECSRCKAKYTAWVERGHGSDRMIFTDLSFRSTFNDEPGPDDLPDFEITETVTYASKPWPRCATCGGKKYGSYGCKDYGKNCA